VQNGYTQEKYAWSADFPGIINAWSSGAADTKRNRLLIFGGGHVTYKGSNVYAYNLAGTPSVQMLNPPSVEDGTAATLCSANGTDPADGTPVSRHSYGGLVYIPTTDKLFAFDGGNYCATSQNGMFKTWLFDLTTNTWADMHANTGPYDPENPGGFLATTGSNCNFDPNTGTQGSVWCMQSGALWILRYDVALNQWTRVTSYGTFPTTSGGLGMTSVIDPVRKLWIFVGDSYTGNTNTPGPFKMYAVDISSGSTYAVQDWSASVSGCSGLGVDSPGLAYDTSRNKIVGYPGTGNTVYTFDSAALSCTTQTFSGGPTTDSGTSQTGTFGRWQYFPALGAYALANSTTQDAFLLRLSTSTGDTTPPTVSITSPSNGASVTGTVTLSATASDNVAVASVQFTVDGVNLGAAVTSAPYSTSWNTTSATAGTHTITAVATDTSGNGATATPITVVVTAAAAPPPNSSSSSPATPITGLGASTLTCLDRDGDQYGVGPGCLGPDADDTDPKVHTGADCIAAYGTLAACIAHLGVEASQQPGWSSADQAAILAGYASPTKVLYLAPSTATPAGNDSNPCTLAAPCLTQNGLAAAGYTTAGVQVIMRQGWNGELMPVAGSSSIANVILSYPGEQAIIDAAAPNTNYGIGFINIGSYVVIDGVRFQNGGGINGGTWGGSVSQCSHVIFRNIDGGGTGGGSGNGAIQMFNGLSYLTVELYVGHDDTNQHGIYMGSRELPSDHVVIRKTILFKNNWNGMHWNGRCTNCLFTQIISYSAGIAGLSFQEGLQNSTVSDILTFNTGSAGIDVDDYNGTGPGTCSPQGNGDVCPYDQTGNTFENITIYSTGNDGFGNSTSTNPTGIIVGRQNGANCNTTECLATNFGNNTFRNLVIVPWGVANSSPAIMIKDDSGGCGATCQSWVNSSTFTGIISKQNDGKNGAGVFWFGSVYTCAAAIAAGYPVTGTCLGNTDPQFVAASPSYWNSPNSFNFGLQPSSPASAAGTAVGVPAYDVVGYPFPAPPSIGAYAVQGSTSSTPVSSCDLNGDGVVNSSDVQLAINQALGISTCSSAALQGNGQCNVVDVQRVIIAALGGACITGQ
jgi:hypothetical protein